MKKVIDLNKYKSDKENETLIHLKKRVKDASKRTIKEVFSMWYTGCFVCMVVQFIIVCFVEKSINIDFTIKLIFNIALSTLIVWTTSKIFNKCMGNRPILGSFKHEKEKFLLEKEAEMYNVTSELKYILIMSSDKNLRSHDSWISIRWYDNNSLLKFIKSNEYKKFKLRLQQTNNFYFSKMIEEEKKFIKLNDEINLLSNLSKKDLERIS